MLQSSDAATPFSIDDILGNELSEKYHQNRAKKQKTNNLVYDKKMITLTDLKSKAMKQEEKQLSCQGEYPFTGGETNFCDGGPHSANDDAIEQEIAKLRHEFVRNYQSSFSPHSFAGVGLSERVTRDRLQDMNRSHPKHKTPHPLGQADKTGSEAHGTTQEKPKPPSCSVGGITVTLENSELWQTFNRCGTEMILNRSGRRMFPYVSVRVEGMNPLAKYSVKIDIRSEDDRRYKFINSKWIPVGLADPEIVNTPKDHVDSPNAGAHWMKNEISFAKLKITNNKESKEDKQVLLHSMHKYKPWIVITEESNQDTGIQSEPLQFTFDVTSFVAVTAYQNENITQLKIHNNPFAKAFRDTDVTAILEGACMLTGSTSAAIKALYGNEPGTGPGLPFRSSMLLHNIPHIGTRMPEHELRRNDAHRPTGCYNDQRAKISYENMYQNEMHRLQVLRHRDRVNSIYMHPDCYTNHRRIPFHRHPSYVSPFFAPGMRSIHVGTPYDESGFYHNRWNYNRVKRLNQDIGEWFDLSRSNSKSRSAEELYQRSVKSQKFGQQRDLGFQQKQNKESAEYISVPETKAAFPDNLQAIENTACARQTVDNKLKAKGSDSDLDETLLRDCKERDGIHQMLRVPALRAGIPGKKCNPFPNVNPNLPLDLVKRKEPK